VGSDRRGAAVVSRKRRRLVPRDGVEVFEMRIAFYFDGNGEREVRMVISDTAGDELSPDLHDVLGVLETAKVAWCEAQGRVSE
jgi:hypothetical protein